MSPYLEIIAHTVYPSAEAALINPATQVVDLISGPIARPRLYRILCAKGMAKLEIPGH
jgi:hypothetical protein